MSGGLWAVVTAAVAAVMVVGEVTDTKEEFLFVVGGEAEIYVVSRII